jgi:hypothetical protein
VLKKKDINPFVITPILQYSNTPKLIVIESYHDGLPSFGLLIRIFMMSSGFSGNAAENSYLFSNKK